MLFADVFSVYFGVGGCLWPISAWIVLVDVAFWKFSNNRPNYAFVADAMIFCIMLYSTYNDLFYGGIDCIGVLDFGPRKQYPPDMLCSSGFYM